MTHSESWAPLHPIIWERSSFCADHACIEVARVGGSVMLRDSKDLAAQPLRVSIAEWRAFLDLLAEDRPSVT